MNDQSKPRYGTLSLTWFEGEEPDGFGWTGLTHHPSLRPWQLATLLRLVADTLEENARESGTWDEPVIRHDSGDPA